MPERAKPDTQSAQTKRLAAALRENLKRRKAQARARAASERSDMAGDDDPKPHDSAGFNEEK
jgi:hypothetical protein